MSDWANVRRATDHRGTVRSDYYPIGLLSCPERQLGLPQNLRWNSPQRNTTDSHLCYRSWSLTPDSTRVLDTLRCFLKIC